MPRPYHPEAEPEMNKPLRFGSDSACHNGPSSSLRLRIMIPKMLLHTLAAVVLITGLAGAFQVYGDGSRVTNSAGQLVRDGGRDDD